MKKTQVSAVCSVDPGTNSFVFVFQEPKSQRWVATIFDTADVINPESSFETLDDAFLNVEECLADLHVNSGASGILQ